MNLSLPKNQELAGTLRFEAFYLISDFHKVMRYFFETGDGQAYGWPFVMWVAFEDGSVFSLFLLLVDLAFLVGIPTIGVLLLRFWRSRVVPVKRRPAEGEPQPAASASKTLYLVLGGVGLVVLLVAGLLILGKSGDEEFARRAPAKRQKADKAISARLEEERRSRADDHQKAQEDRLKDAAPKLEAEKQKLDAEKLRLAEEARLAAEAEAKGRKRETAQRIGTTVETALDLGNGVKLELVLIPAGTFMMGSPETEEDRQENEVQHEVTLTKAYWMGKYEVTQEEYERVMGESPARFKGARNPVEYVSWDNAQEFCRRVSQRTGREVRLPTEAEWEYACRAGRSTPFHTGETISTAEANYNGNYTYGNGTKGEYRGKMIAVGSLASNALGLYDMHGNVWEWCGDRYGEYGKGAQRDPTGAADGMAHVLRGGSWRDAPGNCRSALRVRRTPDARYFLGFRVVVTDKTSGSVDQVIGAALGQAILANDFMTAHKLLSTNLQNQMSAVELAALFRESVRRYGVPTYYSVGLTPGSLEDAIKNRLRTEKDKPLLDDLLKDSAVKNSRRYGQIQFRDSGAYKILFKCDYITVNENGRVLIDILVLGTYSDTVVEGAGQRPTPPSAPSSPLPDP